ncbi:type IV pilus twitching motility protein PilT [Paenibacillus montanisoli]|uniref:Type IV pili twitching motility protein PilT n=1 Tax=Paenibacillus montanisoli TaxID=2081970 RepID=A0A328TWK6_9BACL|nr:type IV pilus twitching motility protein PilT [Paenibacillus montanisoli]RAP74750.1 type IV pili twitching motility protein PilT [Paenibacillus montanisoli]
MKEMVDELLLTAFHKKASDIHLTTGSPPIFRIQGDLRDHGDQMITSQETEGIARVMIPDELWEQFQEKGEIDLAYSIPEISRFRVNVFTQRRDISLAIRIIPSVIPSLEQLRMPDVLHKVCTKPQGLFLVTGPTGSGKSTTLASMLDYMNKTTRKHMITLEDPIEYLHKHDRSIIDQREVGADTRSFANGLRAALRQDPDVILVGELRDLDTISTAISAAETGHLVLGTLHTTDAPSTIDRIIDVFPPGQQQQIRIQLASVLIGVLSQRLLPTIDHTGRRAATEILVNTSGVANLIRSEKVHQIPNVMQTSRSLGMHTLEMSLRELMQNYIVSREVAEPYLREMTV